MKNRALESSLCDFRDHRQALFWRWYLTSCLFSCLLRFFRSWTTARQWTGGLWGCWCMRWWQVSLRLKPITKTTCLSPSSMMTSFTPCGSARRPCPFSKRSVRKQCYHFFPPIRFILRSIDWIKKKVVKKFDRVRLSVDLHLWLDTMQFWLRQCNFVLGVSGDQTVFGISSFKAIL